VAACAAGFAVAAMAACSSDEPPAGGDGGEAGAEGQLESTDYVGLLAGPDGQAAELELSVFPRAEGPGVSAQALGIPGTISGSLRFPSEIGVITLHGELDVRGETITFEGTAARGGQVVDCSAQVRDSRLEGDCRVAGERWPLQALTTRLGTIQRFCGSLQADGSNSGTLNVLAASEFAAGVLWASPLAAGISGSRSGSSIVLDVGDLEGAGGDDTIEGRIAGETVSGTYRLSGLPAAQRTGTFSARAASCPSGDGSGGGSGGAGGAPSVGEAGAPGAGGNEPDPSGGTGPLGDGGTASGEGGQGSGREISSGYFSPGNLVVDPTHAYFTAAKSGGAYQLFKVALSDGTESPIMALDGPENVYLFGSDLVFTHNTFANYPDPSPCAIRKVARGGGQVTPLWTTNASRGVGGLMFDTTNGRIYFFADRVLAPNAPSTTLVYIPTQGGAATPVKTVPYVAGPVMYDALNVYLYGFDWNAQSASTATFFIRQPLDGGDPIASPVGAAGGFVTAVEADKLYVCHQAFSTKVERITRATGFVEVLGEAVDGCRDLAVDADHVYWATNLGGLQRATKTAKDPGQAQTLVPETLLSQEARVVSLALLGDDIYYLAAKVGGAQVFDGNLVMLPKP
jgi:hypothetical protein